MTTDFQQNQFAAKKPIFSLGGLLNKKPQTPLKGAQEKIELTRNNNFLDGTYDLFDVLNKADEMLQEAEKTIERKTQRIRKLEHLACIDDITGLLNERGFVKALIAEIARTNRGHNEGGLLVIFGLENIDMIREHYGEEAMSRALVLIAKAMESEIRPMDWAGRIHDGQFVLLFSDTRMEEALTRLQNMALRLNKLSLIWHGDELHLSLSLGLKSFQKGANAHDVFQHASQDLEAHRHKAS